MDEKKIAKLFEPITHFISSFEAEKDLTKALAFRDKRILQGEQTPSILFHMLPIKKHEDIIQYNSAKEIFEAIKEIPTSGGYSKFCYEGYFLCQYPEGSINEHAILWKNGSCEIFLEISIQEHEKRNYLCGLHENERKIFTATKAILNIYENYSISPPFALFYTLRGVKGTTLPNTPFRLKVGKQQIDVSVPAPSLLNQEIYCIPPSILQKNNAIDLEEKLKPIFDRIWNALGHSHSINWDSQGRYVE